MRKKVILGLVTMFFVAVLSNNTFACSCAATEVAEHVKSSDIIFVGEIVSVKSSPNSSWDYIFPKPKYNIMDIDATFRITRALKNIKVDSMLTVSTVTQSSMCGVSEWAQAKPRQRWLVFTNVSEYGFETSICSLTGPATTESVEAVVKAIAKDKQDAQVKKTKSDS